MFRIHYEHKGGYFCFQVPFLWLFWQKVMVENEDGGVFMILKFKTYAEAKAQAENSGLARLYMDYSENNRQNFIQGNGVVASGTRGIV